MQVPKPEFDFPKKIHLYEQAEMVRIDELIANFGWIYKLSVQLRVIGQGFAKSLQKALVKSRSPTHSSILPFECEVYHQRLEGLITAIHSLSETFITDVDNADVSFQDLVIKEFRAVSSSIARLKKDHQKLVLKRQQYTDANYEALNMELGYTSADMEKTVSQARSKVDKLKESLDADETAYKDDIANQHASLEKIDWTAMALIAEVSGLMGDYFVKLTKEMGQFSAALKARAQSDKTKEIMETFALHVASLPRPHNYTPSAQPSPRPQPPPAHADHAPVKPAVQASPTTRPAAPAPSTTSPSSHPVQHTVSPPARTIPQTTSPAAHPASHTANPATHTAPHTTSPTTHAAPHTTNPATHTASHTVNPATHVASHTTSPTTHVSASGQTAHAASHAKTDARPSPTSHPVPQHK